MNLISSSFLGIYLSRLSLQNTQSLKHVEEKVKMFCRYIFFRKVFCRKCQL